MKFPTSSQMIDENTISYYSFDGNATDACGKYNLYNYYENTYNKNYAIYTTVGTYPGGGEIKAVHCIPTGGYADDYNGFTNPNLMSYIQSNTITLDFAFKIYYYPEGDENLSYLISITGIDRWDEYLNIRHTGTYLQRYSSGNLTYLTSNKNTPLNVWNHFVLTRDSTNAEYTCYINGKFINKWNASTLNINGIGFFGSDDRYPALFDTLYLRISKGLRYTEEFIGLTPLDDVFYTLKEKNNEVYGKLKG